MNPYSYPADKTKFNLKLKEANNKWLYYTVDFPSAQPTTREQNNVAYGEYFRPVSGEDASMAILIHGLGDHSIIPCKLLARTLIKKGVACFILYLAFHSRRMPLDMIKRLPNLTPDEWFDGYKISVVDVRQIVDWAHDDGKIEKRKIAVIGISLGGFISAISMGVDNRIDAGVFITMGGNYESITWAKGGSDDSIKAEYDIRKKLYSQYLAEIEGKGLGAVEPSRKSYLTDPMTFAHNLRQRPILMINALRDKYIPRQATIDFWRACDEPDISWYPCGHSSIWLLYPLLRKRISHFLECHLGF